MLELRMGIPADATPRCNGRVDELERLYALEAENPIMDFSSQTRSRIGGLQAPLAELAGLPRTRSVTIRGG
jgi:hypothetical protein